MRIIHTADWHLGQHFMGKSREPEHQAFLDWLLDLIKEQNVEALIIAGDIFDTGAPPSYARQLYNRFVVELLRIDCQLVVVGGNHDSAAMLEESRDLLDHVGIRQIARPADNPADQVVKLSSSDNPDQPGGLVCAVPFIRPRDIVKSIAGQDSETKQKQLQTAIADHYQAVYDAALKLRADNGWNCPIMATGHLTVVGATSSDAVRDIYIGTLEAFTADGFPPADYIALGHIHGAQKVGGSETTRYSGSPIPLSFDESGNGREKSVVQITLEAGVPVKPEIIQIPQYRSLHTIRGSLETIEEQLAELITVSVSNSGLTTWLEIIVETQDYLNDLQQRITVLLEGCDVDVLLLRRQRPQHTVALDVQQQQTLNELTVDEIFDYRLKEAFDASAASDDAADQHANADLQQRLKILYRQVVSEVRSGETQ